MHLERRSAGLRVYKFTKDILSRDRYCGLSSVFDQCLKRQLVPRRKSATGVIAARFLYISLAPSSHLIVY